MAKKIDTKTASFFPHLSKSATWEDAWGACWDLGYRLDIYDKCVGDDRPRKRQLDITLSKGDDESSTTINKWELTGDDRIQYIDKDIEYDWEGIMRLMIEWLIANKYIKKPRNSKKIKESREDELKEALKERDRINMRIRAWKKTGKDVTELEKQKAEIAIKIKALR